MSDCPFHKELTEYNLNLDVIDARMHELESALGYTFKDIRNLANAMCGIKIFRPGSGTNAKDYYNSSLATVGDSILSAILSEELFRRGLYMGEITQMKSSMEQNDTLLNISDKMDLKRYVFNVHGFFPDLPTQDRPPYAKHNQYLEAIIGAVFFDSDYETCGKWILSRFYPKAMLDEYIEQQRRFYGF